MNEKENPIYWEDSVCKECGWSYDTETKEIPCRRTGSTVNRDWDACPAFVTRPKKKSNGE